MIYSVLLVVGIYFVIGFGYVLLISYGVVKQLKEVENLYIRRALLVYMTPIILIIEFSYLCNDNLLPMFKDFGSGFVEYIKGYWNE